MTRTQPANSAPLPVVGARLRRALAAYTPPSGMADEPDPTRPGMVGAPDVAAPAVAAPAVAAQQARTPGVVDVEPDQGPGLPDQVGALYRSLQTDTSTRSRPESDPQRSRLVARTRLLGAAGQVFGGLVGGDVGSAFMAGGAGVAQGGGRVAAADAEQLRRDQDAYSEWLASATTANRSVQLAQANAEAGALRDDAQGTRSASELNARLQADAARATADRDAREAQSLRTEAGDRLDRMVTTGALDGIEAVAEAAGTDPAAARAAAAAVRSDLDREATRLGRALNLDEQRVVISRSQAAQGWARLAEDRRQFGARLTEDRRQFNATPHGAQGPTGAQALDAYRDLLGLRAKIGLNPEDGGITQAGYDTAERMYVQTYGSPPGATASAPLVTPGNGYTPRLLTPGGADLSDPLVLLNLRARGATDEDIDAAIREARGY